MCNGPLGKYLSYVARINNQSQIVIQEFQNGKCEVISNHKTGVSSFYWSPDETKIAFIARDEKPQKPESETFIKAFEVKPHGYLDFQSYLSSHLFILNINNKKTKRLTEGGWTVNGGVSWSTDGRTLDFSRKENPLPSEWHKNKIMLLDLESGSLTGYSDRDGFEYNPAFSPNGKHFVYSRIIDQNPAGMRDLFIQTGKNKPVNLTRWLEKYFVIELTIF